MGVVGFSREQIDRFLLCGDFESSLTEALNIHYVKRGKINIADFSRRAGFSSRSFLSEVLNRKKGLSRDALMRIRGALKLPKPFLDILELRAYQQMPELRPSYLSTKSLSDKLASAQSRLKTSSSKVDPASVSSKYIRRAILFRVYAGLGSLERGASREELVARTKIPSATMDECLKWMKTLCLIEERGDRFFVKDTQLDLFGLSSSTGLSELVSDVCRDVRQDRDKIIDDPLNMIFYSAFSTSKSRLSELKRRLHAAVFEVLDEFQEDDGDCVRQIFFVQN